MVDVVCVTPRCDGVALRQLFLRHAMPIGMPWQLPSQANKLLHMPSSEGLCTNPTLTDCLT